MPTPKKPASKPRGRKGTGNGTDRAAAAKAEVEATKKGKAAPTTKPTPGASTRPSPERLSVRNSLMVQRLAMGWAWDAIASEAGISVATAKAAVKRRQEDMPMPLRQDPIEIVEAISVGYQASVGDLEAIAFRAVEDGHLSVAVGAKRSANDAREKLLELLQATGRLPQDLGSLRHLIDLRALSARMLDGIDELERARETGDLELIGAAADRIADLFRDAIGAGRDVDGEAEEILAPSGDAVAG